MTYQPLGLKSSLLDE
jgi:hypothetical protein